jgi:hypothetical protein
MLAGLLVSLGVLVAFFDATSVESGWVRALVGLFFGASTAALLWPDRKDIWISKVAGLCFSALNIIGYSIFTAFSTTAQFGAWLALVCVFVFIGVVMVRD